MKMSDVTLESLLEKKDAKQDNTTAQVRQQTALAVETQVENLTPEQEAKVAQIRKEIDLTDSNVLVQYGISPIRFCRRSRSKTAEGPVSFWLTCPIRSVLCMSMIC